MILKKFNILIFFFLLIQPALSADMVVSDDFVKTLSAIAAMPSVQNRPQVVITDEAERLYEKYQRPVYQIRVIDLASGKKAVIGSGFQFTAQGHVATNFHVISEAVHSPKRFKIEFLRYNGTVGELELIAIDVVHDLAILQSKDDFSISLQFGSSDFPKGTRIFAMGNPHDLGMSIVEGTYNGLLEKSMYRKIHFSGSLNGGMSGGPALDYKGHVIGVNVSTYGNQLSFLVPVDYLKDLYAPLKDQEKDKNKEDKERNKDEDKDSEKENVTPKWSEIIEGQLIKNQAHLVDGLVDASWEMLPIGDAIVPGEMSKLFKCWGDSKDESEDLYKWTSLRCSSQDDIYIASNLRTGQVIYNYIWVQSKGLNTFRFYRVFEYWFSQPFQFENAKEEDVRNFKCETGFVKISGEDWKTILCSRQYKKFPKLYDINLNMASVGHYKKGLLVEMVALGVTQEKAQALVRKFMESIKWKE